MRLLNGDETVCIVTGASGKLGRELCRTLSTRMHVLAVCHKNEVEFGQLIRKIHINDDDSVVVERGQYDTYVIFANLNDENTTSYIADIALARYGRIDHLINAAADCSVHSNAQQLESLKYQCIQQMQLNAYAPIFLAAELGTRYWKEHADLNRKRCRSVINISSVSGLYIYSGIGQANYSASKAALNFLTCHLAAEFATIGINVNAIAPTSFPQLISTAQVVAAIETILTSSVTGKILIVDENGERYSN